MWSILFVMLSDYPASPRITSLGGGSTFELARILCPRPMLNCFVVYSGFLESAAMVDVYIRRQ